MNQQGMSQVVASSDLQEYFKDTVHHSVIHLHTNASADAEYYLVQLLTRFASSDAFFDHDEQGQIQDKAMAIRLSDAVFSDKAAKIQQLKKMGDVALFVAGFFSDSFFKKVVGTDYYIRMGGVAYQFLSRIMNQNDGKPIADLFEELSTNFVPFVDVLNDVSDKAHLGSDQNLLKLYERWLKTGSERTRQMLVQSGLIPNEMLKVKYEQ